nr:hypothetical protein [Tanacetum cinerariifolium]
MNLYKALVDAYECDKIILDTYGDTVTLKRRHDDADEDEEPFAGSDRGTKRRIEGKEPESTSAPKEKASKNTSAADDQPIAKASQHPEWFQKQKKPPTPNRVWNKTLPAIQRSIQPWISNLAKQVDTRASFNELMDTLVEFSAFMMNRLNKDTLTPELLAGPTYELMKGSFKSLFIRDKDLQESKDLQSGLKTWYLVQSGVKYRSAMINILSGESLIGGANVNSFMDLRSTGSLLEIDDDKLYKFKEGDLKRLRIQDIKDTLLLLPDTYRSDLKHKEAYTAYSNPRGFIYKNKDKQNRLMRIDELHKFRDDMLNNVRTALDDRLKGIQMKYLPQTIWKISENERAAIMIQAIDKQLKTRRIMRSLEKFVGRRLYDGDFRMLQQTI